MANVLSPEAVAMLAGNRATRFVGSFLKTKSQIVTLGTTNDTNDVILMMKLPSNVVLNSLRVHSTAMTSGAISLGLRKLDPHTAEVSAAVGAANLFGSVTVSAAVTNTDYAVEAADGVLYGETPLWKLAGLAEDPQGTFWIAGTVTTDIGAAGTFRLTAEYF